MHSNSLMTGAITSVLAVSAAGFGAQGAQSSTEKPPASPRSSHDRPIRSQLAPHHSKPVVDKDGKTLLWAGGDPKGGEGSLWFDMTDALVNPHEFQFGIGKDRIPSIDDPEFVRYGDSKLDETKITDQTDVIGYVANGVAKAYPLFIIDHHEVVNDDFAGEPVAVYW